MLSFVCAATASTIVTWNRKRLGVFFNRLQSTWVAKPGPFGSCAPWHSSPQQRLYGGHGRAISKAYRPHILRHRRLDHGIDPPGPPLTLHQRQKQFVRELLDARDALGSAFGEMARQKLEGASSAPFSVENMNTRSGTNSAPAGVPSSTSEGHDSEHAKALRAFRLLRPGAAESFVLMNIVESITVSGLPYRNEFPSHHNGVGYIRESEIEEAAELNVKARLQHYLLSSSPSITTGNNAKAFRSPPDLPSPSSSFFNTGNSPEVTQAVGPSLCTERPNPSPEKLPPLSPGESALLPLFNEDTSKVKSELYDNFPILNPRGYMLAVDAVCDSLATDLQALCKVLGLRVSRKKMNGAQYLEYLINKLFHNIQFEKNQLSLDKWMNRVYQRLSEYLCKDLQALGDDAVKKWLSHHLARVIKNQRACKITCNVRENVYNAGRDLLYDELPLPETYIDEVKFGYPFHQAGQLLQNVLQLFQAFEGDVGRSIRKKIGTQFQALIGELQHLGLKDWLQPEGEKKLEDLPKGDPTLFEVTEEDINAARVLLRAASRGKHNILDLESLDPFRILYGINEHSTAEKEVVTRYPYPLFMTDDVVDECIDLHATAKRITARHRAESEIQLKQAQEVEEAAVSQHSGSLEGSGKPSQLMRFIDTEKERMRFDGPLEWLEEGGRFVTWRWRQPEDAQLDATSGRYIRNTDGVNPLLNLSQLRIVPFEIRRLQGGGGATLFQYSRAIVALGDAQGFFGTATGFGTKAADAFKDATLKALQNSRMIDHDNSGILCNPVQGQEYGSRVQILFRRKGRGIKANARHLPLAYLMGFRNMCLRFLGRPRWLTRHRALRRALEQVQSRRTLANATGQRYALLAAPGDYSVHWPDKWFEPIVKDYEQQQNAIKNKAQLLCRRSRRSHIADVVPEQLQAFPCIHKRDPTLLSWHKLQHLFRTKSMRIYHKEMLSSATRKGQGPSYLRVQHVYRS